MSTRLIPIWLLTLLLLAGCGVRYYPTPPPPPEENASAAVATGGVNAAEHIGKPHVVLISFDGFRADYFDRVDTPNFDRIMVEGARAEALIPVYPTKTFPNHYSIATGMYADGHGIVSNSFYDPERDETYSIGDRESVMDGSWYGGEPLWVTAERQGMVSASFFWVGSEADVQGIRPSTWIPYDGRIPHETRIDSVLTWLTRPQETRAHMITLYFSRVDATGHRHGPDAPEVDDAIREADRDLGLLLDGLDDRGLADDVYVVIVSDHGMADYWPETAVAIDDIIDMTGIRMPDSGAAANLHVDGGPERVRQVLDELNAGLERGRAYLRQETPAHLHYRTDPRIGDIVIVMDEHWQIRTSDRLPRSHGGTHGWDPANPSMHGIFLARGPGIRAGRTIPTAEAVDVYPLIVEILGLEPGPDVQGRSGRLHEAIMAD